MIHDIGNDLADAYNTGYSDGLKDGKNSSTPDTAETDTDPTCAAFGAAGKERLPGRNCK